MNPTAPIVYGDDGTRGTSMYFALDEARRRRAPLRIVHCAAIPTEDATFFMGEALYRGIMADGQELLDTTQQVVEREAPDLEVAYVLSDRPTADVLVDESESAQLVVTGIDDIPWYDRLIGGAVAGHVARLSHCPVTTVPDSFDRERRGGVVVALDGSSAARPLLGLAFELAQDRGCTLHAIRVVSVGAVPAFVESARASLAEVLAGWGDSYPDVRVEREVVVGEPSQACVDATRSAELVLVGRSAHHALRRPTSSSVVRHAACPVVVVPLDAE